MNKVMNPNEVSPEETLDLDSKLIDIISSEEYDEFGFKFFEDEGEVDYEKEVFKKEAIEITNIGEQRWVVIDKNDQKTFASTGFIACVPTFYLLTNGKIIFQHVTFPDSAVSDIYDNEYKITSSLTITGKNNGAQIIQGEKTRSNIKELFNVTAYNIEVDESRTIVISNSKLYVLDINGQISFSRDLSDLTINSSDN